MKALSSWRSTLLGLGALAGSFGLTEVSSIVDIVASEEFMNVASDVLLFAGALGLGHKGET